MPVSYFSLQWSLISLIHTDANGTPTWYTFYENCTYPVDDYFWLNSLHPTFPMMNVTAQEIVRQLS